MGFLCTAIITWITVGVPVWSQDSFYFIPQPSDLEAVEGRSATLECGVSNSKHITFYWTLNGEKVHNTTRRYQQVGNLHITRVDPRHDIGEFRCVATNVSTGISLLSQAAQINILWISDGATVVFQKQQSTLKEGGVMVLQCKVDGYPSVHVEWYRNGIRLFRSETVTLKSKKLELSELSVEDNGIYSCRAANDVRSTESVVNYPLILKSKEVAQIVELPKTLIVPKNGTARFDCVYENAKTVSWYLNEKKTPLVNDTRITVYMNGTLHISSVQETDEGTYLCTATSASNSSAPKQTYSALLKLAYINEFTQNNFEPSPQENGIMAAPEGGLFEVTCIAPPGQPKPTVIWLGPDGRIISDSGSKRVDDSRLIIENVKESDIGNYTCTAENPAGATEATIVLYVTVPPVITSKAEVLLVDEGDSVALSCNFVSSPYPLTTVHWLKDKKHIRTSNTQHLMLSQDSTLQITNVQLSDAGAYSCEVNTTGFDPIQSSVTTLNVKEKLKFVTPPVNKNLELNSNAKIYCKARGTAAPVVRWMKEGRRTFEWPPHIKDENGTLHFNTVRADDAGKYTCIATSSQGIINATIKVDVVVLPKFEVPPVDTVAYEGFSAMIHCRATGDPLPTIQWDKNNILSGFDENRFVVMQNGSLFIKDVHISDEGKYGCTAGNSGGFKRAEVSFTVKGSENYYPSHNGQGYNETSGNNTMTKTVMITLGAAAVYMTLVIGLMIWCRFRRARRKALMLSQACTEAKAEDGDGATEDAETKTKCRNGDCQDGNMYKSDGELQSSGSHHSKRSRTSYDKLQFPHSDLQMMMLLGSGDYGDVYLAKANGIKDGEAETVVMVKLLQTKDENAHFEYKHEMEMFHKLHHCNTARLLGLCRDSDPFMMILEYTDWGDLKQFLLATRKDHSNTKVKPSPLSVGEVIGACHQVALGMENLSNHRFIHKDLATRNCLISSNLNVKVSCPSLSKDTYAQEYYNYHNKAVPLRWAPAEAVLEDEWSTKSDVWSFAVLVWEVFNQAEIPFRDKSDEKVLQMLKKQQVQWQPPSGAPEPLHALLTQCWNQSPKDRPSFSEIVLQIQKYIDDSKV